MIKINEKIYDQQYEIHTRLVSNKRNKCFYLKALFNTLIEIRPKICLEIGTNTGNSAKVFQNYFDKFEPNGVLITCDIKKYVDLSHLKNVKQVIVSHHISDISKYHQINDAELSYDYKNSVTTNINILQKLYQRYDFAFIDGDHTKDSFLKDIQICDSLLNEPKYMLIDDTKEPVHECSQVYYEEIKNNNKYCCYDFEDWKNFVGCSLIYNDIT